MGILGDIFSSIDSAKRNTAGLVGSILDDPQEALRQHLANANNAAGVNLSLLGSLYQTPSGATTLDQSQWSPTATAAANDLANQATGAVAGTLAPFKEGPHYRVNDLSTYTPSLYRETSIDAANDFLPGNMTQPTTLHFANDPAYALGQGANKGVMMEFDAKGMPGQLNLSKPTARQAYDSGYAEFINRDADPSSLGSNLRSVTVDPTQQTGPYFRRLTNSMQQQGWGATKAEDGSIVFQKPN